MKSKYNIINIIMSKGRRAANEKFVCSRDNNGWTIEKSHYRSHKTQISTCETECSKHDWRQCSLIKVCTAFGGDHVEHLMRR